MSETFWYARATVRGTVPRRVICVQCDSFDRALYLKERMRANPLLQYALVLDRLPSKKSVRRCKHLLQVLTVHEYELTVKP